jgi:hypothetical protein
MIDSIDTEQRLCQKLTFLHDKSPEETRNGKIKPI